MRIISGSAKGVRLKTLEGLATRPTLDRVKEALFSKIQFEIPNASVLDLFAGSGALGIEALSRGANSAVLCDNNKKAISIIRDNLEKTNLMEKALVICSDYQSSLQNLAGRKFDIIFLDPPYQSNFGKIALEEIIKLKLLSDKGMVILETDEKMSVGEGLKKIDEKKYGRINLVFLNREG